MEQADFACVVGQFMLLSGVEVRDPVFSVLTVLLAGRKMKQLITIWELEKM